MQGTAQNSGSAFHIKRGGRTRLYVQVACEKCETPRSLPKHNFHPPLCRRCEYASRSSGPVKVRCLGSDPYVPFSDFSDTCEAREQEIDKPRKQVKSSKRYRTALDATRGVYRCKPCSGVVNGIRWFEKRVRGFLRRAKKAYRTTPANRGRFFEVTGFHTNEPLPKIQSRERLSEWHRACNELSRYIVALFLIFLFQRYNRDPLCIGGDYPPDEFVFDPHLFKPRHQTKVGRRRANSDSQRKGLLVKYAKGWLETKNLAKPPATRRTLPDTVKGLCLECQKIVLSSKPGPVRMHALCYGEHWGNKLRRGLPPAEQRPGGQVDLELLRERWAWTIRNKLGDESLQELSKDLGVPIRTIRDGITFIMDHLPDPQLVPEKLRRTVELLYASTETAALSA